MTGLIAPLRRFLIACLLVISSLAVSGCSNSENSAGVNAKIGNETIGCVKVDISKQTSSLATYKDTFKFAFEGDASKDFKYVKNGDKVDLDFGGVQPDKVTVKSIMLSQDGEQAYNDTAVTNLSVTGKDGKFGFTAEITPASAFSSVMQNYDYDYNGLLITADFSQNQYSYAFVVKTDSISNS